jgi:hypothetical protein
MSERRRFSCILAVSVSDDHWSSGYGAGSTNNAGWLVNLGGSKFLPELRFTYVSQSYPHIFGATYGADAR